MKGKGKEKLDITAPSISYLPCGKKKLWSGEVYSTFGARRGSGYLARSSRDPKAAYYHVYGQDCHFYGTERRDHTISCHSFLSKRIYTTVRKPCLAACQGE